MARTTFQVSVDLLRNRPVGFENRSIVAVLKTVRQMQMCLKWSVPPENASPSDIIRQQHRDLTCYIRQYLKTIRYLMCHFFYIL